MATKTKMVATKATNTSVMEAGVEPQPPGPGCLVRSSCITDSWGMRPRLEQDPTFRRTLVRRTLDWYGLVYVHRGSGTFYDPHGSRPVRAGDLVCLFPGVPHAYGPDSDERWDEISISRGPPSPPGKGPGYLIPMSPSDGWSRSALLVAADAIDVAGLERLVDHVVGGGVHGLFVLGTTGAGPELLPPEACGLGRHGAIPGGANVMPRLFADLYAAVMAGDTARVESLRGRARQLANLYDVGRMPGRIVVGIKTALGNDGGGSRRSRHPARGRAAASFCVTVSNYNQGGL